MDNGLYFMRVEPAGGGRTVNGGILVLRNGKILGGDAFFYYVGSYSSGGNSSWRGEFSTRQHTRSDLAVPVFGGTEVTVTFSGTYAGETSEIQLTSPGGGYRVALRRIADA